jgi:hypothetical protein
MASVLGRRQAVTVFGRRGEQALHLVMQRMTTKGTCGVVAQARWRKCCSGIRRKGAKGEVG